MISLRGMNEFHWGQLDRSRMASRTAAAGAEISVVARIVKRPPSGYVGVGRGGTAEDFVKGDFGEDLTSGMVR